VHAYERSFPVANGTVTPSGITYLVVGAGGNREGHATPYEPGPEPAWSAFRNDTQFGHGRLTFFNDTHLGWVWFSNEEGQKAAFDSTWIVRSGSGNDRTTAHSPK
jgi:hypothetical protein